MLDVGLLLLYAKKKPPVGGFRVTATSLSRFTMALPSPSSDENTIEFQKGAVPACTVPASRVLRKMERPRLGAAPPGSWPIANHARFLTEERA